MSLASLDLNLLRVLRAVYDHRSVSKAASQLGMTQSAVSNALKRLRLHLRDPLFVRSAHGMLPSSLVESVISPVQSALAGIEGAMRATQQFDAATSDRLFRILGNDLAQLVFAPRLLGDLAQGAPGVRLEMVDAPLEEGRRAMDDGLIDLALGNWPAFGAGHYRQRLFSERLVVLMSKSHPLYRRRLGKADYLKSRHVDYRPGGATYESLRRMLDKVFAREGIARRVAYTAPHALGLSSILAQSDLLLTLPSRLADSLVTGRETLGIKPLPFPSPELIISQQWHARAHRDPAVIWLRQHVARLFGENATP